MPNDDEPFPDDGSADFLAIGSFSGDFTTGDEVDGTFQCATANEPDPDFFGEAAGAVSGEYFDVEDTGQEPLDETAVESQSAASGNFQHSLDSALGDPRSVTVETADGQSNTGACQETEDEDIELDIDKGRLSNEEATVVPPLPVQQSANVQTKEGQSSVGSLPDPLPEEVTFTVPRETTEGNELLHGSGIPPSRRTTWEREGTEHNSALAPQDRINNAIDETDNDATREAHLEHFFGVDQEPDCDEIDRQAQYLQTNFRYIHEWHRKRRIRERQRQASTGRLDGNLQATSNQPSMHGDNLESTASGSHIDERTSFTQPPSGPSIASQTTAPITSSQFSDWRCTKVPECNTTFPNFSTWLRHETTTKGHWPQKLYICLLCQISLDRDPTNSDKFACNFCESPFESLEDVQQHILSQCASKYVPKPKNGIAWMRKCQLESHHSSKHPQEVMIRGDQLCWKCIFCNVEFKVEVGSLGHVCQEITKWLAGKALKERFENRDSREFETLLGGWNFDYDSNWPKTCKYGCPLPSGEFKDWDDRIEHYRNDHFGRLPTPSPHSLKRNFNQLGLVDNESEIDNDESLADSQSQSQSQQDKMSTSQSGRREVYPQNQRRGRGRGRSRGRGRGSSNAPRQSIAGQSGENGQKMSIADARTSGLLGPAPQGFQGIGALFEGKDGV